MRDLGLIGVRRGKKVRTTAPDPDAKPEDRPSDLLDQDFTAAEPNRRMALLTAPAPTVLEPKTTTPDTTPRKEIAARHSCSHWHSNTRRVAPLPGTRPSDCAAAVTACVSAGAHHGKVR